MFSRVTDSTSFDMTVKLSARLTRVDVVFVDLSGHDVPFSFGENVVADDAVDEEFVFWGGLFFVGWGWDYLGG